MVLSCMQTSLWIILVIIEFSFPVTHNYSIIICHAYHVIVQWACTEVVMLPTMPYPETFTGINCQSMLATGFIVVSIVFVSNLSSLHMGPMQVRPYQHPLHTLGVDYVGELPVSSNGNKWILTAVCPFSNYLRAIPVPDKTATMAANALFNDVFLLLGFSSVLQSDCRGEWLKALLHYIMQLLSIRHVFTSGFCPRLNGATKCTHRFLNAALGIYCEHQQEKWEEYLQSTVYAHNASPISGISNITPFFLVFGWDALSPESISLALSPKSLPPNHYAKHIVSRMTDAHKQFSQIKADLHRQKHDIYNEKARLNYFYSKGQNCVFS